MLWDKDPRAVAPCAFMEKVIDPILSTLGSTEISPLPYGVGVYVDDPKDGTQRDLPLYWVSAKAANARGIKSAWYVCADPNMAFTLRVTHVQAGSDNTYINGVRVESGKKCGVEIFVDGVNVVGHRKYKMASPGKEREIRGFTVARSMGAGQYHGKKAVRVFRFMQTATVEEGCGASTGNAETIGKIELRQFCGPVRTHPLVDTTERYGEDLTEAKPVGEKTAIKDGCSIAVDRTGCVIREDSSRSTQYIERVRGCEIGNVTVFVREKRWLEIHKIIDSDGEIYREPPTAEVARPSLKKRRKRAKVADYIDLTRPKKVVKEAIIIDD